MMVVMSLFSKMAWLLVTGLTAWLQTFILPSNSGRAAFWTFAPLLSPRISAVSVHHQSLGSPAI